jgi:hypothetical protein
MASLDEIRKRFAKMNPDQEFVDAQHPNGNGAASPANNSTTNVATSALGRAALKIFDPLKRFELQVSEIIKIAEPLTRVLNQTARTLEEIKVFASEMERLAKAYDGIRTFQAALNAEAARDLRRQFDGIEKTFHENLSNAAALLDPAREFQTRIAELAKIFDGLKPLQERFSALAKTFQPQQSVAPKTTVVLEQPATPNATVSIVTPNAAVNSNSGRQA